MPASSCSSQLIDDFDQRLKREGLRYALTLKEVAAFLGRHYNNIWTLIQSGDLPAKKRRGRWLVFRRDLAAWLHIGGGAR